MSTSAPGLPGPFGGVVKSRSKFSYWVPRGEGDLNRFTRGLGFLALGQQHADPNDPPL
jgi:hypothetical protein